MIDRIINIIMTPLRKAANRKFYKQFIGKGKLFFDIGANHGVRTAVFRDLGLKVIAVEPQSACVEKLKKKFNLDGNVIIVNKGVGEAEGTKNIQICSSSDTISTFSDEWKNGRFKEFSFDRQEKVQITTLDELIGEYGLPDFIKIDVEGYEMQVISGLTQKVPCLNFEFSSEFIGNTIISLDRLTGLGYASFNFVEGEDLNFKFNNWQTKPELVDYLQIAISKNPDLWGDIYVK